MSATPWIKSLYPVDHASAQGAQKENLDVALKQVGFIPNMYANMVNAPAVLGTYLHGYALFRSESAFTPAEQEVVFLAVSDFNGCTYCTAAHSMIADRMSGVPKEVLAAIRAHEPIQDPRLATLFAVTQSIVRSHGKPDPAAVAAFLAAGYAERDLLYIVLAAAVKTLSNYTNHAFGTQLDPMFAAYRVD